MPKIVKSAMGETVDWDLLRVKASMDNMVADPVVINSRTVEVEDRRAQRTRVENARRVMAQMAKTPSPQLPITAPVADPATAALKASAQELDDNGWTD